MKTKLTPAHLLFTLVEQYGLELGTEAFYAHHGFHRPTTIKGQARLNLPEDKDDGETFYAVLSTPITAVS